MTSIYLEISAEIGAAWVAGALIGWERSYHGRAAGFRTHALVALASAAAVMVSLAPISRPTCSRAGRRGWIPPAWRRAS